MCELLQRTQQSPHLAVLWVPRCCSVGIFGMRHPCLDNSPSREQQVVPAAGTLHEAGLGTPLPGGRGQGLLPRPACSPSCCQVLSSLPSLTVADGDRATSTFRHAITSRDVQFLNVPQIRTSFHNSPRTIHKVRSALRNSNLRQMKTHRLKGNVNWKQPIKLLLRQISSGLQPH